MAFIVSMLQMSVAIPVLERISTAVRRENRLRHAIRVHHHLAETLNAAEQTGLERRLANERGEIRRYLANKGSSSFDRRARHPVTSVITSMSILRDSSPPKNSSGSELGDNHDVNGSEPEVQFENVGDVEYRSYRSDDDDRTAHKDGQNSCSINTNNVTILEEDSVEKDDNKHNNKKTDEKNIDEDGNKSNDDVDDDGSNRCRFELDLMPISATESVTSHSSQVQPSCRHFPCYSSSCYSHPIGFGLSVPDHRPLSPLSFTVATNTSR